MDHYEKKHHRRCPEKNGYGPCRCGEIKTPPTIPRYQKQKVETHNKKQTLMSNNETVCIPLSMWKDALIKIDTLESENKRLRSASFVTAVTAEQYERVIKAGDAVVLCFCGDTNEKHKERCAINWLAAKEGRDAK